MKSFLNRLIPFLLVSALPLFLAACGGDHGKGKDSSLQPAFDVSGTWSAIMDGVYLGQFHFKMSSQGNLSGDLETNRDGRAKVAGSVVGYKSEFTITFSDTAYLASLEFHNDRANASGTLVDKDGRVHSLVLYKQ
jgi:hypothetical protein